MTKECGFHTRSISPSAPLSLLKSTIAPFSPHTVQPIFVFVFVFVFVHFPYSTQPSHNSHLTHQTYLYIYIYTYMYTFPAEFQHHTFSSTQQNQCLYLYLHLYTGSTVKPQPLCVQGTQLTQKSNGMKMWATFSSHLIFIFSLSEGTFLSRCPFITICMNAD